MQLPSRYTLNWPLDPPFLDPEIYANPVILGFLESYWETDDFQVTCLHSNNPWPGSTLQRWHRDTKLLTPGIGTPRHPHFGVKIPLVDTKRERTAASRCCPARTAVTWPKRSLEGRLRRSC